MCYCYYKQLMWVMVMKKLLIADASQEITAALERQLQGRCQIYTCHWGEDAIALIHTLRPDILFIDLALPPMTGLDLLQRVRFRPPVCIARTNIVTDKVVAAAWDMGIRHLFLIPCTAASMAECICRYL